MKQEGAHQYLPPSGNGQITPLSASGAEALRGRVDEYVAPIEAARHLDKNKSLRLQSGALCFPAHDVIGYLPVLTSWMQSPWFLKL